MADKPIFFTFRKHWKKSLLGLVLVAYGANYSLNKFRQYLVRREFCDQAKEIGLQTVDALQKPRRLYVILNPQADGGNAQKSYEQNAAPIFHLSGIDVTLIRTDYEGHAKSLLGYIDTNIDGIVVAGGDGTLLEVVTGFLRQHEMEVTKTIPVGILPVGKSNAFFSRIFSTNSQTAREIGQAAMAIVKAETKPVDLIEIQTGGKPTYALSSIHWGAFQEVKNRIDARKYWWAGPWRSKAAFIVRTLRGWPVNYISQLSYPMKESITDCKDCIQTKPTLCSFSITDSKGCKLGIHAPLSVLTADNSRPYIMKTVNCLQNENSYTKLLPRDHLATSGIGVYACGINSSSHLHIQIWEPNLERKEFVKDGWNWLKKNYKLVESDHCKNVCVEEFSFAPGLDHGSWYHIDGEVFEAKPIQVKLLPNRIKFFLSSS